MIKNKAGRKIAFFTAIFFQKISEYIYKKLQKSDISEKDFEEEENAQFFQSSPYPEEWAKKIADAGNINWVEFSIDRSSKSDTFANYFLTHQKEPGKIGIKRTTRQDKSLEKTKDNSLPKVFNRKAKVWIDTPSGTNLNRQTTNTENYPKLPEYISHEALKETQHDVTKTENDIELSESVSHEFDKKTQHTVHPDYKKTTKNSFSFVEQKKRMTLNNEISEKETLVQNSNEPSSENKSIHTENFTKPANFGNKGKLKVQQYQDQIKTSPKEKNTTEPLFLKQNTSDLYEKECSSVISEKNEIKVSEWLKKTEAKTGKFPDLKRQQDTITTKKSEPIHLRNFPDSMTDTEKSIIKQKNDFSKINFGNSKGIWPELPAIAQNSQLNHSAFNEKERISFLETEQKGAVWSVLRF